MGSNVERLGTRERDAESAVTLAIGEDVHRSENEFMAQDRVMSRRLRPGDGKAEPNQGAYLPLTVAAVADQPADGVLALNTWAGDALNGQRKSLCALHGGFGVGKSTLVRRWLARFRRLHLDRSFIMVDLRRVAPRASILDMVAEWLGLVPSAEHVAVLRERVAHRRTVLCLDAFETLLACRDGGAPALADALNTQLPEQALILLVVRADADSVVSFAEAWMRTAGGDPGVAPPQFLSLRVEPLTPADVRAALGRARPGDGARLFDEIGEVFARPEMLAKRFWLAETVARVAEGSRATTDAVIAHGVRSFEKHIAPTLLRNGVRADVQLFGEALAEAQWRAGERACTWSELQVTSAALADPPLQADDPIELRAATEGGLWRQASGGRLELVHPLLLVHFLVASLLRCYSGTGLRRALDTAAFRAPILELVFRRLGAPSVATFTPLVRALQALLRRESPVAQPRDSGSAEQRIVTNAARMLIALKAFCEQSGIASRDLGRWIPAGARLDGADLRDLDLSDLELDSLGLEGVDLSRSRLTRVGLQSSNLKRANLRRVTLRDVDLQHAVLDDASLTGADGHAVTFCYARLLKADMSHSTWIHCDWQHVDMAGATTSGWLRLPPAPLETSEIGSVARSPSHDGAVAAVAWSWDGHRIATAGHYDRAVHVREAMTGDVQVKLGGEGRAVLFVMAWQPRGQLIATGSEDSTVRLWDAASGKVAHLIALPRVSGSIGLVTALAWSRTGERLFVASDAGVILSCAVAPCADPFQVVHEQHGQLVTSLSCSPCGRYIASSGLDRALRVWDLERAVCVAFDDDDESIVSALDWSPDGTRIASVGHDGVLRIRDWHCTTMQCLRGHEDLATSVQWCPLSHSELVATAGADGTLRIWSAATERELGRCSTRGRWNRGLAWSPDGARLVSGDDAGTVSIWDVASLGLDPLEPVHASRSERPAHEARGFRTRIRMGRFSRARPASREAYIAIAGMDETVRVWAADGRQYRRLDNRDSEVTVFDWHSDGQLIASGDRAGRTRVWDVVKNCLLYTLPRLEWGYRHEGRISALAWEPGGERIATGGDDGRIHLWHGGEGAHLRELKHAPGKSGRHPVTGLAWRQDVRWLASAHADGTVRVWDPADGAAVGPIDGTVAISALAWGVRGEFLVTAASSQLRIYQATTRRRLWTWTEHSATIRAVAWSPDDRYIASAGYDRSIHVWDVSTLLDGTAAGQAQRVSKPPLHRTWKAHSRCIRSLDWSPDSQQLLSTANDGRVCVWDLATAARSVASCEFTVAPEGHLVRTSTGFFMASGDVERETPRLLLATHPDDGGAAFYRPLGALDKVLQEPSAVGAALRREPFDERIEERLRAEDLVTE